MVNGRAVAWLHYVQTRRATARGFAVFAPLRRRLALPLTTFPFQKKPKLEPAAVLAR